MNRDEEILDNVLGALRGEMSRVMRHLGFAPNRPVFMPPTVWRPATDVFETASDIVIRMEIAGVRKEELVVVFENNLLTVRGVRREDPQFQKTGVSRMEIDYGPFQQSVALPQTIDPGGIDAAYKNGFLTVRVPKSAEVTRQSVCIQVKE